MKWGLGKIPRLYCLAVWAFIIESILGCSGRQQGNSEPCTEADREPVVIHWAKPEYPKAALAGRIEGTVVVKVQVGVSGEVEKANILTGVDPLLDEAAVEAALKCVFEPGVHECEVTRAWMALPFNFKLKEE